MFTGLVEETGAVRALSPTPTGWRLAVSASAALADCALGDSIAVNGCCLTVVAFDGHSLAFDLLEETLRLTSFRQLQPGTLVNLERSLRFNGKVGGHFVTGHIDGLGEITAFEPRGSDHYLRIQPPPGLARYLVHKGCIAVDGISLTVAEVNPDGSFALWLIPHTLAVTNLHERKAGDVVNLECDLLAKYVERLRPA
jgi:riboflavin synthase